MPKDYYAVLGLSRGASLEEIKKAYRRLSKELHPDRRKGGKDSEARYKEVNEAYEVLSDPKKKQMYDQFGTADSRASGFAGSQGFPGFDFSEFSKGFRTGSFEGVGDIFETFFGGGKERRRSAGRGEDLEMHMTISFMEMVRGIRKEFTLKTSVVCGECEGKGAAKGSALTKCKECSGTGEVRRTAQSFFGQITQSFVCPVCEGRGEVPERACTECAGKGRIAGKRTVKVDIPAGIEDGQTLRVRGQGGAGERGAEAGDLFVRIRVEPDARFTRDGHDVRTELRLGVIDAILGTTAEIETVHGKVSLKIPEGTQPGSVLRIAGKGIPIPGSSRTGDHYVEVHVEIPKKLSRREREIVEEWRKRQ